MDPNIVNLKFEGSTPDICGSLSLWRMKNLQIWSRDIDRKILHVALHTGILGLASSVGLLYPTDPLSTLPPINALVSGLLLILVWGVFHLFRPLRPGQTWLLIERMGIPAVWMLLLAAFLFAVHTACARHLEFFEVGGFRLCSLCPTAAVDSAIALLTHSFNPLPS